MNRTLIYLAVPYSHPDARVRDARFHAVNNEAARMMADGLHVFSPISHTHPIALAGDLPTDWAFWQEYDKAILRACCKLVVLMLPGWDASKGIAGEMVIAREMAIPIEFIEPTP